MTASIDAALNEADQTLSSASVMPMPALTHKIATPAFGPAPEHLRGTDICRAGTVPGLPGAVAEDGLFNLYRIYSGVIQGSFGGNYCKIRGSHLRQLPPEFAKLAYVQMKRSVRLATLPGGGKRSRSVLCTIYCAFFSNQQGNDQAVGKHLKCRYA